MAKASKMEGTKKLMAALVGMKPKPHEDMKLGKTKAKKKGRPKTTKSGA